MTYLPTVKQLLFSQNDSARRLGLLEYYFRMENLGISRVRVYAGPLHSELLIQLAVNPLHPINLKPTRCQGTTIAGTQIDGALDSPMTLWIDSALDLYLGLMPPCPR